MWPLYLMAGIGIYWVGMTVFLLYGVPLIFRLLRLILISLGVALGSGVGGLGRAAFRAGRGAALAAEFIVLLVIEWVRGPRAAEPKQESAGADENREASSDEYADARERLGLGAEFTEDELKQAWKRAIRKAHPDAGGSEWEARAINAARERLARQHGWR